MTSTFASMSTAGTMLVCMYRSASAQSSGVWASFILGRMVTGAVDGCETDADAGGSEMVSVAGSSEMDSVASNSEIGSVVDNSEMGTVVGSSEMG